MILVVVLIELAQVIYIYLVIAKISLVNCCRSKLSVCRTPTLIKALRHLFHSAHFNHKTATLIPVSYLYFVNIAHVLVFLFSATWTKHCLCGVGFFATYCNPQSIIASCNALAYDACTSNQSLDRKKTLHSKRLELIMNAIIIIAVSLFIKMN